MLENKNIFSVTAINNFIKELIENNNQLKYIYIRGEVSNSKLYGNGNFYFTLKDQDSAISAVIFNNYLEKLKVLPRDGDKIVLLGSLTVYGARGTYQVRGYDVFYDGEGQLLLQLEALKAKLQQEGLFDSNRKRSIPKYPSNIGIVTSYPSAACEDLIKNINRRYPLVNIYVFPSLVQGITAPNELIKTLSVAYTYPLDVLIIARGGGSIEDLWAFNDENLIRKLATSPIPTISAIGHEIDFTLCDFVCDVRASTPTGAAEIATPNKEDILYRIDDITINLKNNLKNKLYSIKERFIKLKNHTFFTNQLSNIKSIENDLTLYKMRLLNSYKSFYTKQKQIIETKKILLNNDFKTYIKNIRNSLEINYSKLNSLSPKNVLKRGYSYLEDENGKIISSINDVKENQIVKTTLKDGMITLEVIKKGE